MIEILTPIAAFIGAALGIFNYLKIKNIPNKEELKEVKKLKDTVKRNSEILRNSTP